MSDDIEEARGRHVLIRFEGRKCIHSRNCVLARPDVFVPNVAGEWIHPDAATPDQVAALAASCPSGAITYERLDGGAGESPPGVNVARVRENGPYALHGTLAIEGHGTALRATLCRCGQSQNKPFCDGAHASARFTATGEPEPMESPALESRDGALTVRPLPDGPLQVLGNLEVCSGTGRTITRTTKTALCRCGHSGRKPFCDGTHKRVGFRAP